MLKFKHKQVFFQTRKFVFSSVESLFLVKAYATPVAKKDGYCFSIILDVAPHQRYLV